MALQTATSSSFRAVCSRGTSSCIASSSRTFATTSSLSRNVPARRPRDPLNHDPSAVRHALPSGETLIVRRPPTPPTSSNVSSADSSTASPLPTIETDPSEVLPPPLKPTSKRSEKTLGEAEISQIQKLRAQDPFKNTPSSLSKQFGCSRTFVQMVAPLKDVNVRRAKEQKQDIESGKENWGWNKRLSRELRSERRALW